MCCRPQFAPIKQAVAYGPEDIALFTLSKMTGAVLRQQIRLHAPAPLRPFRDHHSAASCTE